MLEIKSNVTGMKSALNGLIRRLDMAKERLSGLEDDNRNFQNWKVKKKRNGKNWTTLTKNCRTIVKGVIYTKWEQHHEKKEGKE